MQRASRVETLDALEVTLATEVSVFRQTVAPVIPPHIAESAIDAIPSALAVVPEADADAGDHRPARHDHAGTVIANTADVAATTRHTATSRPDHARANACPSPHGATIDMTRA